MIIDMRIAKNINAFTLIELSIVLIIISLIVGGVVGGQSLVKSAKVNQMAKDLQIHKTAFILFQDQYDYSPGDIPNAQEYWPECLDSGVNCNGDGNKKIDSGTEQLRVYEHLSLSELLDNKSYQYTNTSTDQYEYYYKPPINANVATGRIFTTDFVVYRKERTMNYLKIIGVPMTGGNRPYIDTADVKKIDLKIDDGLADDGKVIAYCLGCGANPCTDALVTATGANYLLSNKDTACRIQLEIN